MSDTVIHPKTTAATRDGVERIAELWPQLSEDVRLELIEIAEESASGEEVDDFVLTAEEMASLKRAKEDFAAGRTMTHDEARAEIDALITRLAARQCDVSPTRSQLSQGLAD